MLSNRKSYFLFSDYKIIRVHEFLYKKHRELNALVSLTIYALVILIWGAELHVSANYFILLPLIVISISYGFRGGLLFGICALPANLLLFKIIGHLEFSPESIIIPELFGIIMGSTLGYVSDFFMKMQKEIELRMASETALEQSLKEKEILLQEINHRVKNNLNLIKSIIQLQINRIPVKSEQNELKKLNRRVLSVAIVQDLLFSLDSLDSLDFRDYLQELIKSLFSGYTNINITYDIVMSGYPIYLESKKITSIGLIINEVITNAVKYAFPDCKSPHINIELSQMGESIFLKIKDNGKGYPTDFEIEGLGLKLIRSLTANLKGEVNFENKQGGNMTLIIPLSEPYDGTF